ncbi:hypothetical protein QBC42DRAFT_288697 [Cladorrhinum samala]|uniref:Uncharacterized protein n=1 Tax=Cladorrhinum samala TaxID=585594 RepID=A0AAV9HHS3_9PEZI|nr:hypothetical protein QBC42DRAFT_288697 [Cladorrhinum samala]
MERDSRRDRGQWRGCYTFKDITIDGESRNVQKRDGGLKMGNTYYYYYEIDGSTEIHDPAVPSTSTCPYLPGQSVNTLEVPVERSLRNRSASASSLRQEDFKTMDPVAKFTAPKPVAEATAATRRVGTSPQQHHKRSARSLSPGSGWSSFSPRKLFSRKASSNSLQSAAQPAASEEEERHRMSSSRSEGSRSRDISPESLRRFLADDAPIVAEETPATAAAAVVTIPEDIVEENEDEDDNFATSAVSETMQFTGLSPPPARSVSPSPPPTSHKNLLPLSKFNVPASAFRPTFTLPKAPETSAPETELDSPDAASPPAFYYSEEEDNEDEEVPPSVAVQASKSTYSLPPQSSGTNGASAGGRGKHGAPTVPSLLDVANVQIPDSGLDDLVSELGWMAGLIRGRYDA